MSSAQVRLAALIKEVPAEVDVVMSLFDLHVYYWPIPADSSSCSHKRWITSLLRSADRLNHHFGIQWRTPVASGDDNYWIRNARELPGAEGLDDAAANEMMARTNAVCGTLVDPLQKLSDGEYYTTFPGDQGPPTMALWFYGGNSLHVEVSHESHYDTEPRDLHLMADIIDLLDHLCVEAYGGDENLMAFELRTAHWDHHPEPSPNPPYLKWDGGYLLWQSGLYRIETGRLNTPETHERIKQAWERWGWNVLDSRDNGIIPADGLGGSGASGSPA